MIASGEYNTIRVVDTLGAHRDKDGKLTPGNARLT